MKFSIFILLSLIQFKTTDSFVVTPSFRQQQQQQQQHSTTKVYDGYLDDISKYTAPPPEEEEEEIDESVEATNLAKEKKDRFGVGDWKDFKEFNEFDGGDGQMGVAGDGNKGLEKIGQSPSFATSKFMSAKNAWGSSTGYAEELRSQGVETARAQQLENWHNQREVVKKKNQMNDQAAAYESQYSDEENWRSLAKFGIDRNQEFDMNAAFGDTASIGDTITGTIELHTRMNTLVYHEFSLKNDFMGFADFRAAFTPETNTQDWIVEPTEGSLSKEPVNFIVKFRPSGQPGLSEGYLVIETEDMKKTYKLIGNTA